MGMAALPGWDASVEKDRRERNALRGCRATLPVYGMRKCGWRPQGIPLRLVTVAGRAFRSGRMNGSPCQTGCHVRPAGVPRDAWHFCQGADRDRWNPGKVH